MLFNFSLVKRGRAKMGTSMVRYGDYGFWARDALLEIWLLLLVRELDAEPDREDWLNEVRDEWEHQGSAGCNGCIAVYLNRFAKTEERRQKLLEISRRAHTKMMARDDNITLEEINAMKIYGPHQRSKTPVRPEQVEMIARPFINLLSGDVEADKDIFKPR